MYPFSTEKVYKDVTNSKQEYRLDYSPWARAFGVLKETSRWFRIMAIEL